MLYLDFGKTFNLGDVMNDNHLRRIQKKVIRETRQEQKKAHSNQKENRTVKNQQIVPAH